MVVDDSAVVRGLVAKWLGDDPAVEVVATASNGDMALKNLASADPEIVVLDIEMPVMDGLTALPKILEHSNEIQVLMSSTLTTRNAEISMRALSMGAADYVSKPESTREVTTSLSFQQELVGKVVNLAAARRLQSGGKVFKGGKASTLNEDILPQVSSRGVISKRKMSSAMPKIIGVGSSTGGPQALLKFLNSMKDELRLPVLVTQHMPPAFTNILAEHLGRATGLPCKQAEDGDVIQTGHVYVAPGDYHMIVENRDGQKVIRINQDDPENFCRPAVDPLFRSLAKLFGSATLGVVLTGMGHDGLKGAQEIVNAGGTVIAQDEATSIVWGMPGAVSQAGLCSAVLPLDEIGEKVIDITKGEAL
ncbi:protein-glutamate methylesterase/protein-glutamine glutaminase [Emcibacter sp.]|uniref:protein-glutamate methylesterase/protein-glutamine glutaminase n=1 Tax=Emcibacter sp. TaxID=1979954 RepID=UPI003A8D5C04